MAISNSGSVGRGRPFSRLTDYQAQDRLSRYDVWQKAVAECRRWPERMQHESSRVPDAVAGGASAVASVG